MKRSTRKRWITPAEVARWLEIVTNFRFKNPQVLENLDELDLDENLEKVQEQYDEIDRILQRLKRLRQKKKLSLIRVCARIGIARASISRLENRLVPNPTINTLQRYAVALGYNLKLKLIPIPKTPRKKI